MWLLCEVDLSQKSVDSNRTHLVLICFDSLHIPNKFQRNCLHSGIFPPHRMDGVARHMMSWRLFAAGHDVAWRLMIGNHAALRLFSTAWLVVKWAISEFHPNQEVYLICWVHSPSLPGLEAHPACTHEQIRFARPSRLGFPNELAMKHHWIMSQIQLPSNFCDLFHLQPLEAFDISTCPQEKVQLPSSERWNFVVTVGKSGENFWYKASLICITLWVSLQT